MYIAVYYINIINLQLFSNLASSANIRTEQSHLKVFKSTDELESFKLL